MPSLNDLSLERESGAPNDTIFSESGRSSDVHEKFPEKDGNEGRNSSGDEEREETVIEVRDSDDIANAEGVPPSSRLTACLQVLGAWFLMLNSWGLANTFGAFQTYYEGAIFSDQSPSNISWIGSIQVFLLLFVGGGCTGQIFDAGHLREMVVVGSVLAVFGMMMTSICQEYWQAILAQGITIGLGAGFLLLPSVAVFPQYFTHRRAFATGIAASGSSLGGVIYPIIFHKLNPKIGFGWSIRVLAFIMLATLLVPVTVMRAKSFPATRRPFVDWQVFREVPYVLFTVAEFFGYMGMFIPFYYISSYGFEQGIVSKDTSFYLLTILNAASIFGRIVPNFFADIIGPLNMMAPFSLCCAIVAYSWTSITSLGQIVVFCMAYGFLSGTFVSVTGPALATLSPDLALVGTHIGMSFALGALGLLIGNPIGGLLLDNYGWIGPAAFCGTANALAAIFIIAARVHKVGWRILVKA